MGFPHIVYKNYCMLTSSAFQSKSLSTLYISENILLMRYSMKNSKKNQLHSIKFKILFLTVVAMLFVVVVTYLNILPKVKKKVENQTQAHILTTARMSGQVVNTLLTSRGYEVALNSQTLAAIINDNLIEGLDSCYGYVVDANGIILYHPDENKIGQVIEIDAVKMLVEQTKQGIRPEQTVMEYEDNGAAMYASYYVNSGVDFILVISASKKEIVKDINEIRNFSIIVVILVAIICSVICICIVHFLLYPINILNKAIQRLSTMNFKEENDIVKVAKRKDETGDIAKSLLQLKADITDVVKDIRSHAGSVYESVDKVQNITNRVVQTSKQMRASSNEIAQGAISQAKDTQSATEQIMLMGDMVEGTKAEINSLEVNSGSVRQASQHTLTTITDLNNISDKTKESINSIYNQTMSTNDAVVHIHQAVEAIKSIASQTSLLSLNASIEAAKAGEFGKGFSVVASEIKKLSEQSESSAKQVSEVLDRLTAESEKSVMLMNEVQENYVKQNESVNRTKQAFDVIESSIDMALESIHSVTNKANSLDESRCSVVDVVQSLNAIAEENAACSKETAASIEDVTQSMNYMNEEAVTLSEIADSLKESINRIIL